MSSKRILIVEDDPRLRFVLERILESSGRGYEIVTAENGLQALDEVKASPFDLMITDLRMQGMGGMELSQAVRTLSPSTIVVWLTAYSGRETKAEAQRLGVHRCVDKVLEVKQIRQIVHEALTNG